MALRCTETRASHKRAQLRATSATSESECSRHMAASKVSKACTTAGAQSLTVSLLWMMCDNVTYLQQMRETEDWSGGGGGTSGAHIQEQADKARSDCETTAEADCAGAHSC
jgi:hypothetical protein